MKSPSELDTISTLLGSADSSVLSMAKTNWYFGEWEELAKIDIETQGDHPDVALLVALKASGYQQLGEIENCRKYVRAARQLGCNQEVLSRLLIAGIDNSLGKIAALQNNEEKSIQYFSSAVNLGSESQHTKLACYARSVKETARLGLLPQAAKLVGEESRVLDSYKFSPTEKELRGKILTEQIAHLNYLVTFGNLNRSWKYGKAISRSSWEMPLIVVAGMRHSGSTALFNIVRLALLKAEVKFVSGYAENESWYGNRDKGDVVKLIKVHEFRDDIAYTNGFVFTTRRDLRDTVASAVRRGFRTVSDMGGAAKYARYNRTLHDIWMPHSNYVFIYEQFMQRPLSVIESMLDRLGLNRFWAQEILAELVSLPTDKYKETLLSPTHVTDPERQMSFRDTLSDEIIQEIDNDNTIWLAQYGY